MVAKRSPHQAQSAVRRSRVRCSVLLDIAASLLGSSSGLRSRIPFGSLAGGRPNEPPGIDPSTVQRPRLRHRWHVRRTTEPPPHSTEGRESALTTPGRRGAHRMTVIGSGRAAPSAPRDCVRCRPECNSLTKDHRAPNVGLRVTGTMPDQHPNRRSVARRRALGSADVEAHRMTPTAGDPAVRAAPRAGVRSGSRGSRRTRCL
jgi:hypothetical protein